MAAGGTRKCSLAPPPPSCSSGSAGLLPLPPGQSTLSHHRRFSHTVTRKLSHSLGWGSSSEERGEIVSVGRSLCWQYMRSRLKRSGLFTRKRGLTRLRSSLSLGHGALVPRLLPALLALGAELERLRPDVYSGVSRQTGGEPGPVLRTVGKQLAGQMSWPRLVSLFAVAGGLAADVVRAGRPEEMTQIADAMAELVDEELASWIADNGGWTSTVCVMISSSSGLEHVKALEIAELSPTFLCQLLQDWFLQPRSKMGLSAYWKPLPEEPPLGHYVGLLAGLLLALFLLAVAIRVLTSGL